MRWFGSSVISCIRMGACVSKQENEHSWTEIQMGETKLNTSTPTCSTEDVTLLKCEISSICSEEESVVLADQEKVITFLEHTSGSESDYFSDSYHESTWSIKYYHLPHQQKIFKVLRQMLRLKNL